MKHILFLTFVLFSTRAAAQLFTVTELKELRSDMPDPDGADKDTLYVFPVFGSVTRPEVATKINLYLQLMELSLVVGHQTKGVFEHAGANNGYHYTITANNDRLLSITFEEQSCAMHCLTSTTGYSFDARTGDVIGQQDHFSADALTKDKAPLVNRLFRGKIGDKYPVSIILHTGYWNEDANVIRGVEVYDKVGVGIELLGTVNGNHVTLHEMDAGSYNKPVSDMELAWDGTALSGTFKNIKNNNLLSFRVSHP